MLAKRSFPLWSLTCFSTVLFFAFVRAQRQNSFIQPRGGDTLTAGQPYNIQWSPVENSGPVFIQLSYGADKIYGKLTASEANDGSFLWTPGTEMIGSDYFLVICNIDPSLAGTACSYTFNGRLNIVSGSSLPSQLSSTTKIVIGVLVPITVIALVVAGFLVIRRRRVDQSIRHEFGYTAKGGNQYSAELPSQHFHEMAAGGHRGAILYVS